MTNRIIAAAMVLGALACQKDRSETWQPLNLMSSAQAPITVLAPEQTEVSLFQVGTMKDISLQAKGKEKYALEIYTTLATTRDLRQMKTNQLREVRSNPQFLRLIQEDAQGFIYVYKTNSGVAFSFRYFHLQGDQEVVFTPGMDESFTLTDIKKMYAAVQQNP